MKILSKKIIVGNWKMNLNYRDSVALGKKVSNGLQGKRIKTEAVVMPDFSSLASVAQINKKPLMLGAQDVAQNKLGAYTGEVSLESLKQLNCSYILIGHSERRQYFFDDEMIADKMKNVLENSDITPILCIGESLGQKRSGKTMAVLERQMKTAFSKVGKLSGKRIIIAYEPIWAIGTGRIIIVAEAIAIHKKIKSLMEKICRNNLPKEFGILYGGSINLKNFSNFKDCPDISGLLIGGSSLKAGDFLKIVNNF